MQILPSFFKKMKSLPLAVGAQGLMTSVKKA